MRCRSRRNTHVSADMGIYAQDRWTIQRATINAGVRFDYFKTVFPEQVLGPASFVPDRNLVIPETPYANTEGHHAASRRRVRSLWQRKTSLRSAGICPDGCPWLVCYLHDRKLELASLAVHFIQFGTTDPLWPSTIKSCFPVIFF